MWVHEVRIFQPWYFTHGLMLSLRSPGDCVFGGFELQYRKDGEDTWTSLPLGMKAGWLKIGTSHQFQWRLKVQELLISQRVPISDWLCAMSHTPRCLRSIPRPSTLNVRSGPSAFIRDLSEERFVTSPKRTHWTNEDFLAVSCSFFRPLSWCSSAEFETFNLQIICDGIFMTSDQCAEVQLQSSTDHNPMIDLESVTAEVGLDH